VGVEGKGFSGVIKVREGRGGDSGEVNMGDCVQKAAPFMFAVRICGV
jgi:hypothetical protein